MDVLVCLIGGVYGAGHIVRARKKIADASIIIQAKSLCGCETASDWLYFDNQIFESQLVADT